jgi:hypothetical protein
MSMSEYLCHPYGRPQEGDVFVAAYGGTVHSVYGTVDGFDGFEALTRCNLNIRKPDFFGYRPASEVNCTRCLPPPVDMGEKEKP